MPREQAATVSPEALRRTSEGLESQTTFQRRPQLVRVPHDEILRLLQDMDRQRAEDRARRREAQSQYTPHDEIIRVLHDMDCQRAEDRTRRREAQPQYTAHTQPPATPSPKPAKRPREGPRPTRETVQLQRDSVESILHHYNATFRVKEQASSTRFWCNEVPVALQVDAAKSFYQAFTEERTLPVSHCVFCYRKTPPCELATMQWRDRLSPSMRRATRTIQECGACLPSHEGARVDVCRECRVSFDSGRLPKACSVNNMAIGCEHRYPDELDDLSPVEERLIALHAPFGYITKFAVDNKTRSGISYRKHVKGHIVVFPNKVDDLVATVLPHPLLQAIENIHVSWSGSAKPGSADVRHLLQVRKSRVAAALAWLQRSNPLYEDVAINQAEIDGWQYADGSSVPTVIMDRMQREEPSTIERTQTDHIVPDTDRGLEENSFRSIDDLVNSVDPTFVAESCDLDCTLSTEQTQPSPGEPVTLVPDPAAIGQEVNTVCETSTSGMFPLDGPAAFAESDKLSFLADIVNPNPDRHGNSVPLEQAYANLTEDRLKRAEAEMRETRTTSDPDISLLLRELSVFGHAQPLSNESRLLMRRKIQALDIRAGMPAIWITISPNDINNPVKMKLAIHRLHDYESAKELLADLREKYDRIALSTMDPVSSAIFFHREISLFFKKYVNTGQESIFGNISHYYATVETNERGSLHLHGLLWLDGNMRLPNLIDDMANPAEEAYRAQVIRYVDSVFHESPWKIVEETGFTEDGLLQIRRNHPLVNRYNKSLAVGLRHNHDVSMILTKTKGLAMVYYITNYATKLDTPMWKRIALATEVARQLREAGRPTSRAPGPALPDDRQQAVLNESRQFLMRTANRIFSERQLSAVEVCYHLLGYDTDFTNVPHWSFLNLTALYWTIFRLWAHLRHQAGELTDAEPPPETIPLRQGGRTLLCLEAYAYRMLVDVSPVTSFVEMGHTTAASFTLNYLQTMALQLVCVFLDNYAANPDSAGQHLQYTGGPGGTGKSRIIDALKDVFAARNQPHLLQITGTSGSSAAQIGGTTIHSACGLDSHRDPNKPPPPFSEAKKWIWKQKLVLVIDEVSMLGGATLHNVSRHLQALRDCPDEPFGGMPVVLLMGDFYQFAPVRETSLLINRPPDRTQTLRQATISHHSGCRLWHMFKTVVLLEDQVRARNDPQLRALLDRVRNGRQTQQDLDLLNANIVGRSQITFHDGLRAITPLNRTRWALNMEAVVGWARFNKQHIRIFVSTHTWRNGTLSPNIVARTIGQGDDSACKVPGVFFYAQGMPVVVNKNIYTGLKVVNGADFTAVDVILDPNHPGYHLADDVTIHFGPPLGILLQSEETKALAIPSLPVGTGKTFVEVLLELRGNRVTNGEPSKCDFTSLYVQLSRCTSLRGIKLLGPVRHHDFIGNGLDQAILDGMQRLKNLAAETRRLSEDQGFEK
ncbi:PIF1-like helicase [Hirsutella rhossiliensis]|uniref:ATP-dependent DNA helicase n=1 Tax=Hirsutella rhossiliensis TaxID=111463 RepID=A0A9P8SFU2_9HYPO|nr:PIF1-like helicase domain-containing protein [Hirsutella rhossiliensis]KAH0959361.1 PIF1-like helicase domain-containing protein [Hirsutella rhossiliensis]